MKFLKRSSEPRDRAAAMPGAAVNPLGLLKRFRPLLLLAADFLDGVVHMGMSGMNEMGLMQFVVHKDKFVMSFDAADFDDDDLS